MTNSNHVVATLITEIDRYLEPYDLTGAKEVRAGIRRWSNATMQQVTPATRPPCAHLGEALAHVTDRKLALAITAALPALDWITYDKYNRSDIGAAFADGHVFASLIGEGSFYHADDYNLGLFLIAPNVLYPDHHHAAPELYAPLNGPHGWRFLPETEFQWLAANIPVWNEAWAPHATLTGDVPFLCIFGWTRDVDQAAKVIFPPFPAQAQP